MHLHRKSRLLVLVLAAMLSVSVLGCRKRVEVVGAPAGVTSAEVSQWYQATGALYYASDVLRSTTETVVQLNRAGVFPDGPEYVSALRALGNAATEGRKAVDFLKTVPEQWGTDVRTTIDGHVGRILGYVQAALDAGLLGIKNNERRQEFQQLLSSVRQSVALVQQLVRQFRGSAFMLREVYVG